jgi:hypothetical protein
VASNKYFNLYHQKQEQKLVNDLVEEAIKIHAIDAVYIPRQIEKIDSTFREDPLSYFNDYHHIEVYIKNSDGFEGDGDIFRKFGVEIKNQITFTISRNSFVKTFGKELERPREGDLIYLPMSTADDLYEIRFVKEDSVFYNLGEFYTYDIQCEVFTAQDESISTGIEEVDDIGNDMSELFLLSIENSTGEFTDNEIIYQGDSAIGATARANFVEYVSDTEIKVKNLFQSFLPENGVVKGNTSGVEAILTQAIDTSDIQDDFSAQNKSFVVIDFSESNPFSEDE